MEIINVPVAKIHVGNRHRTDKGDLEALAANIRDMGLLQPIGVDKYFELIFGWRRLYACSVILGFETIPCVVLSLESILAGEYAENEFRKAFTPSERESIGRAIEDELLKKERRGKPQLGSIDHNWEKGSKSADIAAKRSGFKSRKTYERVKTVVQKGTPALVAAMDSEEVSIAGAEAISSQPKEDQNRIVQMQKEERREITRQIRKTKAAKEKSESRARDVRVYTAIAEAVKTLGQHYESPSATWAGIARIHADAFSKYLDPAIECLTKLKKAHPYEPKRPKLLTRKS